MATTFQLKRSSVVGKQPNVADLLVGELAVNLADGILYSKNTAGNIIVVGSSTTSNVTEGSNLYFTTARVGTAVSSQTLTNATFSGEVVASTLRSSQSSGDEGGQLDLAAPQSNTTISGRIAIDVYQNKLRIFETTGTNRGVFVDFSAAASGVGSNLLIGGGGGGGAVDSVNGQTGDVVLTTSNISESGNLYFTNTRAVSSLTAGTGISIASNGRITSTVTGGSTVTVSSSPPGSPGVGDVWIDSDTAIYYTYINDGDSDQWVEIAASTIYTNDSGGGGGSVDLTSVSSNIVPDADVTYDIGSPSLRFRDLYLSGNTINLGNALIQADAATGAVLIVPTPTAENPNPKATLVSPSGSITSVETSNGTVNTASISNISNTTSDAFFLNSNVVTSNVTIPSGKNAMSAGPITIAANVEVTISLGSEWTVV